VDALLADLLSSDEEEEGEGEVSVAGLPGDVWWGASVSGWRGSGTGMFGDWWVLRQV